MLSDTGYTWLRGALGEADLAPLDALFARASAGSRQDLNPALLAALSPLTDVLRRDAPTLRPVRVVSFNKNPDANWGVPWHQDRVIAVADRHDVPGFTNWSRKKDTWHCEPPVDLLNQMLFVRVHLDTADASDGAMEIAVGSHLAGRVGTDMAPAVAEAHPRHACIGQRGDVQILHMLTLHRSLPAKNPTLRRVLRIDFAPFDLPAPLRWDNSPRSAPKPG